MTVAGWAVWEWDNQGKYPPSLPGSGGGASGWISYATQVEVVCTACRPLRPSKPCALLCPKAEGTVGELN